MLLVNLPEGNISTAVEIGGSTVRVLTALLFGALREEARRLLLVYLSRNPARVWLRRVR